MIGISISFSLSIFENSFCFFACLEFNFSNSLISAPGEKNFDPPIKPIHFISLVLFKCLVALAISFRVFSSKLLFLLLAF